MKIMIAGGNKRSYQKQKNLLKNAGVKYTQKPRAYHSQTPAYILTIDNRYADKAKNVLEKNDWWLI